MAFKNPEAITDGEEIVRIAEEKGIDLIPIEDDEGDSLAEQIEQGRTGCFFSKKVTIGGKKVDGSRYWNTDRDTPDQEKWCTDGMIPGLFCPDCNAQAYFTDHPKVAVCGAFPGWYFLFEGIKHEGDGSTSNKIIMKYLNGILQPVIVTDTGVEVGEKKV
jgi:hypothetical protein